MKYVIGIIINGKCILYMYKAFHFTTILINLPRTRLSVHVESFLICSISCTSFSSVVDMVLLGASFSLQNSNIGQIFHNKLKKKMESFPG